jgi:hypothetical protein
VDISGPLAIVLILQFLGVTLAFLLAARRARRIGQHAPATAPEDRPEHRVTVPTDDASRSLAAEAPALDGLYAARQQLQQELADDRTAQAAALAAFTERRRALLTDLHMLRRDCSDRAIEASELAARVEGLTSEVQHLEQRRDSLVAELEASTTSSRVLAKRATIARQRLAALKLEHERFVMRRRRETARLEDLDRRRALLEAENAELTSLLEVLQQLTGEPSTLTRISDVGAGTAPSSSDQPASTDSAARRPETIAPWIEPVSTWSPATHT